MLIVLPDRMFDTWNTRRSFREFHIIATGFWNSVRYKQNLSVQQSESPFRLVKVQNQTLSSEKGSFESVKTSQDG